MSDIMGNGSDRHEWKRGESLQWSRHGFAAWGNAQTPYTCEKCGAKFIHYYHAEPNIYAAMEAAGIDSKQCAAKEKAK